MRKADDQLVRHSRRCSDRPLRRDGSHRRAWLPAASGAPARSRQSHLRRSARDPEDGTQVSSHR